MTMAENKEQAVVMTTEEWLAIRKEAGLRIDPATAKVTWWWAQVVDPYGIYRYTMSSLKITASNWCY